MDAKSETGGGSVPRTVTVAVGEFALESLGGASPPDPAKLARWLAQAIRYYLADQRSEQAGWPYPDLRRGDSSDSAIAVQVEIEDGVWERFSAEADRQGVTSKQLAQHAVFYFAADRDSGRLARRIAEDLGSSDA
jgi:hypothetical protein